MGARQHTVPLLTTQRKLENGTVMSDENKIRDAADAIKGVAEAIPVYQDVLQPAAKEVGSALQTVAKTIHIALAPVSALVWGYEEIKEYVNASLTERLKKLPPEQIASPSPVVAGPVLEALRFAGHDPDLRELYANLLASSMDASSAHRAHPAFVETIRQMTPDEARIMKKLAEATAYAVISAGEQGVKNFMTGRVEELYGVYLHHFTFLPNDAGCIYTELFPSYLDNLRRLGLLEVIENYHLGGDDLYAALEEHAERDWKPRNTGRGYPAITRGAILVTALGRQFCDACIT